MSVRTALEAGTRDHKNNNRNIVAAAECVAGAKFLAEGASSFGLETPSNIKLVLILSFHTHVCTPRSICFGKRPKVATGNRVAADCWMRAGQRIRDGI